MAEGYGAWVVLERKIDRCQSPSGEPERPQGVPEAGRGVILSFVFVFFEKWSANFWLSPQMQPFQTKTLIFEVPGSNWDVILKRLNDFCDFDHQERMSSSRSKINPLERPKLVQEGQTCGSAKAMQKL